MLLTCLEIKHGAVRAVRVWGQGGAALSALGAALGMGGAHPPGTAGRGLCQGFTVGVCLQQPQPCPLPVRCHPEATRAVGAHAAGWWWRG